MTEPKAAYLDCTAGVAGDMLLGALLDAGADLDAVRDAVRSLGVPGLDVKIEQTRRCGLRCAHAVILTPAASQPARGPAEVLAVIERAELSPAATTMATDTFRLLADAEALAHGVPPERVHFHEVGALDALADVVGCAVAAERLGLLSDGALVRCSALAAGSGTARGAHGTIPIPSPAVVQIVVTAGLSLSGGDLAGERTTPTGAALVAALATPGPLPPMTIDAMGTGAGSRDDPERPNITRLLIGRHIGQGPEPGTGPGTRPGPTQPVTVVETTIDDLSPELWPEVLRAVRAAGAWDCWTTATIGRHGRPGQVFTALCTEQTRPAVVHALFEHSTTLGVRWTQWWRATLPRTSVRVPMGPPGEQQEVTIKVATGPRGHHTAKPELADAERAARALGWSVRRVCDAARAAYAQPYD